MDRSMSAALSATPHSELTLNDISTTSSYNNFPFHGQSNNNNGNGNGNMLASSNSSAATNPNILLLRNRKLQLEVQRKDGEIRRLTREFEASKKKNTATVVELQGEVQRLREQFLEKEVSAYVADIKCMHSLNTHVHTCVLVSITCAEFTLLLRLVC